MTINCIDFPQTSETSIRQVLLSIDHHKQEFAQHPFFQFFLNKQIDPAQRLSFAPCLAPLVMGFAELNTSIFRDEPTHDPIQQLINHHTYEDDHHWVWFLTDLKRFGMDQTLRLSDALTFMWGDNTQVARWVVYELYRYSCQATPIQKLVVIEALEATSNVFFAAAAQVGQELQAITGKQYQYFASSHFAADSEHSLYSNESMHLINHTQLSPTDLKHALNRVEQIFEIFTHLLNDCLNYAQKQPSRVYGASFN